MDDIERFCEITGSSEEVAVAKLSENNYSLRSALNSFMANPSSPSSRDSANGESVVSVPPVHANSSRSSSSLPGGSDSSIASRLFTRANSSPVRRNTSAFSSLSGSISGAIQIPSSGNIDVRGVGGLVSRISDASSFSSRRERLLDSIFKPPYDIIFPGDFFSAKDYARDSDLWLLVDIQSPQNFDCQCLNRDIWNSAKVKKLIQRHFLFIQYNVDTSEGRRYIQFYPASHFPYVSILDPRTGELLQTYQKLTADGAIKLFTDFINERGSPSISDDVCGDKALSNPVGMDVENEASTSNTNDGTSNALMSIQPVLNEEEALKAAIKASLQNSNKNDDSLSSSSSTSASHPNVANSHLNPVILSDDGDDDLDMEDCFEVSRSFSTGPNEAPDEEEEDDDDSSTASSVLSDDDRDFGRVFYGSKTNVNRKRKLKSMAVTTSGRNNHLSGTLKRLKLDKLGQQSHTANISSSSSLLHDESALEEQNTNCNDNSKQKSKPMMMSSSSTLEVQNIGPLMPPPDCSSFPTEVSLLKDPSLPNFRNGATSSSSSVSAILSCPNSQGQQDGVKILLKCPNGERRTINIAASSTLKLFFMGCGSLGYSDMLYEFSTHFPKKILNTLDRKTTFSDLGITQNCIIFVESKL